MMADPKLDAAKQKLIYVTSKLIKQSKHYLTATTPSLFNSTGLSATAGDSTAIALDVKRFITIAEHLTEPAQMTSDEAFEFLFNYGYRENEDCEPTVKLTPLIISTLGGSDRLIQEGPVVTNNVYVRNPKPKITITTTGIDVETPIGMKETILPRQLRWYPEIAKEVVDFTQAFLDKHKVTPEGMAEAFRTLRGVMEVAIVTKTPGLLHNIEEFRLPSGDFRTLETVKKNAHSFQFIIGLGGEFTLGVSSLRPQIFNAVTAHLELPIDYQIELIELADRLK